MNPIEMMLSVAEELYYLFLSVSGGVYPKKLSAGEERECINAVIQGDKIERARLIEHNLRLVAHIVKKYNTQQSDADDMLSIGTIGLIKAVDSYSPDKGVRFSSYASRCIENECLMYLRSQKKRAQDISMNEPIETDKHGNELTLVDVIAAQGSFADDIENKMGCKSMKELIDRQPDSREMRIIRMRYGLDGAEPLTQKETAELFGISRSYVSRIEKKVLEELRKSLE